jgi:hypothetical protein
MSHQPNPRNSISAGTLYLSRHRRVQIAAEWQSRMSEASQGPIWGIQVYVQNEASRPIQLQDVGVVFELGTRGKTLFAGSGREGIGLTVTDGQRGELWFIPASAALESDRGPRTNIYVIASGRRFYGSFPPEPSDEEKQYHSCRA